MPPTDPLSTPDPPEEVLPQRRVTVTGYIDADLWGRWSAACKRLDIRPSTQLAVLIAEFVAKMEKESANNG